MAPPTKYTPELVETARNYVENYADYDDVIPSVCGLSLVLGVHRKTLYEWVKEEDKQEICDILETINAKQAKVLLNKGLSGVFNSAIVKLVLGKHGYHDKQELSGPNGTPVQHQFMFIAHGSGDETN